MDQREHLCRCEASFEAGCNHLGDRCMNPAAMSVPTIYGTYQMCAECALKFPASMLSGEITPINKTW